MFVRNLIRSPIYFRVPKTGQPVGHKIQLNHQVKKWYTSQVPNNQVPNNQDIQVPNNQVLNQVMNQVEPTIDRKILSLEYKIHTINKRIESFENSINSISSFIGGTSLAAIIITLIYHL